MSLRIFSSPWLAAVLAGLAAGFGCLPFAFFPGDHLVVLVGFAPLWLSWLRAQRFRTVVLSGLVAQAVFSLVAMNWIAHTVREFGGLAWPAAVGVLLLYALVANVHIPLAAAVWFRLFRRRGVAARVAGLVLTTALVEMAWPKLFDWNLGYAWYFSRWPAFQLADVIGIAGLGTLSWMMNGLLLVAYLLNGKPRMWALAGAGAAVLLLTLGGQWRINSLAPADASLRALVVQANIGNKEKIFSEQGPGFRRAIVQKHIDLTRKALRADGPAPDFVVWPENAFPDVLHELGSVEDHYEDLRSFRKEINLPIVTGAFGWGRDERVTNGFFVLERGVSWQVPFYFKTGLLAFGEYVPGDKWLPWLKGLFPAVRDFGRGEGPMVLDISGVRVGPQICYEGSSPEFSRESARLGAQLLINLTNDSWYGTWQQPAQHLYLTAARAVETRLPLLRSTNTGFSAAILADGSWLEPSPLHREWSHVYELPYRREAPRPPFLTWGAWLLPALSLAGWLWLVSRSRRKAE